MVCLVFLVVSLNIDIFKYFIQNKSYWKGLAVVPILLMANIFLGIYYNQSIWYKQSGKTQFGAYIAIFGALTTIAINVLFIPKYGYMASAWATLIVYLLQMLISYFLGQYYYPIPYNLRKFFIFIGLALLLYWFGSGIQTSSGFLDFILHNLLILIFISVAFVLERKTFVKKSRIT